MLVTKPSVLRCKIKHVIPGDAERIAVLLHRAKLRFSRAVGRVLRVAEILRHQGSRRVAIVAEDMKAPTEFASIGFNAPDEVKSLGGGRRLHRVASRHRLVVGHRNGGISHLLHHRAKLCRRINTVRIGRVQVQIRKSFGLL